MKTRYLRRCMAMICAMLLLFSASISALAAGEPVRVGYLEGEQYGPFAQQLDAAGQTLAALGYLQDYAYTAETDSQAVWNKICAQQTGGAAEFVADAYYVMNLMSDAEKQDLLNRQDLDVIIVMGTAAGRWLTENADVLAFDYMVYAVSDPISGGLVKSQTERYNDKSFAHIDPNRMGRQISMAYRLFEFTDIGVVYADNAAAYSYSGIAQLEAQAELNGFNIHTIHVEEPADDSDYERYYSELKAAYAELTPQIQALYITTGMIEDKMLPWLLEDVHAAGIYTVAETSESQVEMGALLHISLTDGEEEGDFAARTLDEYIKGTPISQLNQLFEFTPKIAINYDTARLVGAQIPVKVLLIADAIYPQN